MTDSIRTIRRCARGGCNHLHEPELGFGEFFVHPNTQGRKAYCCHACANYVALKRHRTVKKIREQNRSKPPNEIEIISHDEFAFHNTDTNEPTKPEDEAMPHSLLKILKGEDDEEGN